MYQNVYIAQLSQVAILGASNFDVFHALISIQSCADMVHVYLNKYLWSHPNIFIIFISLIYEWMYEVQYETMAVLYIIMCYNDNISMEGALYIVLVDNSKIYS